MSWIIFPWALYILPDLIRVELVVFKSSIAGFGKIGRENFETKFPVFITAKLKSVDAD